MNQKKKLIKDICSNGKHSKNSGDILTARKAIIAELKKRVRSRALCLELKKIDKKSSEWWDEWQRLPFERKAFYNCRKDSSDQIDPVETSKNIGGSDSCQSCRVWIRHQPEYPPFSKLLGYDKLPNWAPLESIKNLHESIAELSPGTIEDGSPSAQNRSAVLRIMRICVPRGGGKGSLVSLLNHAHYRNRLFPLLTPQDKFEQTDYQIYPVSFIAHMSFSMEFNSVIRALSRFLARRIAELQILNEDECVKTAFRKNHSQSNVNECSCERNTDISLQNICDFCKKTYINNRENDPLLALYPDKFSMPNDDNACYDDGADHDAPYLCGKTRLHRLTILEKLIKQYIEVTKKYPDRIFICLSGLEPVPKVIE